MCFGDSFPEKCYGLPDESLDHLSQDLTKDSKTEFQQLPELNEKHNGARPIYFKGNFMVIGGRATDTVEVYQCGKKHFNCFD